MIKITNIKQSYLQGKSVIKVLNGINLNISKGEKICFVGPSGSGKTTLGKCILKATEITNGEILFRDDSENIHNIPSLNKKDLRRLRKEINMIFLSSMML